MALTGATAAIDSNLVQERKRERGKERERESCPALLTSGPDVLLDITAAVIRESIAIACITYPVVSVKAALDRFIKLLPSRSPSQTDL